MQEGATGRGAGHAPGKQHLSGVHQKEEDLAKQRASVSRKSACGRTELGTGGTWQERRNQKAGGRDVGWVLIPAGPMGANKELAGPQAVESSPEQEKGVGREERAGEGT